MQITFMNEITGGFVFRVRVRVRVRVRLRVRWSKRSSLRMQV